MTNVLVTGAGGSIGSEICKQLVNNEINRLTLLSLTESGLYNINRQLKAINKCTEIIPVLGSVTNAKLVEWVMEDQDIVIHAAAHKHVAICQENPVEAAWNNVFGTKMLAEAAELHGVDRFVLVSTDKAVKPTSVMGMTKRIAEMILLKYNSDVYTDFLITRFGNVMDSAGSVLPLWREQIRNGGPLTLTDANAERYFMSIPEAAELVLSVAQMHDRDHGVFVFDMGPRRKMIDVASQLMSNMGIFVPIQLTGLSAGEKLIEELTHGALEPTSHPKISRVEDHFDPVKLAMLGDLYHACQTRKRGEVVDLLLGMTG